MFNINIEPELNRKYSQYFIASAISKICIGYFIIWDLLLLHSD